jgi:hypothetical protein
MDNPCINCPALPECDPEESERKEIMEGITKDTFAKMDTDSKLAVLFDYVHEIHQSAPKRVKDRDRKCANQIAKCYGRFEDLEVECEDAKENFRRVLKIRLVLNTSAALVGGFVGGFMAVWSALKMGWFV